MSPPSPADPDCRVVMTLLVSLEIDLARINVRYHLEQGVDAVVVTENRASAALLAELEELAASGPVVVFHEPSPVFAQDEWVTRMARYAATELQATWVINNDADEFWWPRRGNLKTSLAAMPPEVSRVRVPRSNFVPRLHASGHALRRMVVRETLSVDPEGRALPGKVCHRADPLVEVAAGNHDTCLPSLHGSMVDSRDLEVLHFPLRSAEQFAAKIRLGAAAVRRNPRYLSQRLNWTWLRIADELAESGIERRRDLVLELRGEREALADGRLQRDERLRDFLVSRRLL